MKTFVAKPETVQRDWYVVERLQVECKKKEGVNRQPKKRD